MSLNWLQRLSLKSWIERFCSIRFGFLFSGSGSAGSLFGSRSLFGSVLGRFGLQIRILREKLHLLMGSGHLITKNENGNRLNTWFDISKIGFNRPPGPVKPVQENHRIPEPSFWGPWVLIFYSRNTTIRFVTRGPTFLNATPTSATFARTPARRRILLKQVDKSVGFQRMRLDIKTCYVVLHHYVSLITFIL